jgi:hypothetical protein
VVTGILLIAALAYGTLIPWLGYYWDDWLIFADDHLGLSFGSAEQQFRPLLWELRHLTLEAIGARPLHWHLLALLARCLAALAGWWLLAGVWPEQRFGAAAGSLLFAVYPGFSGQPLGAIYSHVLLQLAVHLASLGAMVQGLRRPRLAVPMTVLSAVLLVFGLLLSEYFVGLELLRPVVLWMVLRSSPRAPASGRAVLRGWSPYLAVLSAYLVWRLAFFEAPGRYDASRLLAGFLDSPIATLASRLRIALADLVRLGPLAWARGLAPESLPAGWESPSAVALSWGISAAAGIAAGVLLSRRRAPGAGGPGVAWGREALLLGLVATCLGQLPLWLAGREVELGTLFDRYALPAAFGSSLAMAGLIAWLVRTWAQQVACVALLVGLAAGLHVRNANQYRHDWEAQRSFFWQLSWRLPELECGARLLVLVDGSGMAYTADHALSVPINWMFPHHRGPCEIRVQTARSAAALVDRMGSRDSLAIAYRPPACLRVLRTASPDLRHPGGVAVPTEVFGEEPAHDGCFHVQQAEMRRDRGQ